MNKPRYAIKWLSADGTPYHGGSGAWSLPVRQTDGSWEPGDWREASGDLVLCTPGALHGCTLAQAAQWVGPAAFLMEVAGTVVMDKDKVGCQRARLVRPLTWDERAARLFACDCAERVLPLFEREHPGDDRPRHEITVARRYADGEATADELAAAWAAAWDAARAAAWDAARDAARAAAWVAAWDAARDAARDAAWDAARDAAWAAECAWQGGRLAEVLGLTDVERAALIGGAP